MLLYQSKRKMIAAVRKMLIESDTLRYARDEIVVASLHKFVVN